ncbi:hypothetical protein LJC59_07400 [Desulfovibrio sp. OttesenSCG-928-A18]|nr:hypothetical protein [Desulfovibrio sp. OttesenSCG-928-A18]
MNNEQPIKNIRKALVLMVLLALLALLGLSACATCATGPGCGYTPEIQVRGEYDAAFTYRR